MSTAASLPNVTARLGAFRRLWRTLQQLFHEVVAAIFAVLAFSWFNAAIRAWSRDTAYWLITVAALIAVAFSYFAYSSFRRSRKI